MSDSTSNAIKRSWELVKNTGIDISSYLAVLALELIGWYLAEKLIYMALHLVENERGASFHPLVHLIPEALAGLSFLSILVMTTYMTISDATRHAYGEVRTSWQDDSHHRRPR